MINNSPVVGMLSGYFNQSSFCWRMWSEESLFWLLTADWRNKRPPEESENKDVECLRSFWTVVSSRCCSARSQLEQLSVSGIHWLIVTEMSLIGRISD